MNQSPKHVLVAETMREPGSERTAMRAYREELRRFVLSRVRHEEDAEDIVQDVLVKAHTGQRSLREPSKLRAWLYQITRHAIIDYYRARRPMESVPDDFVGEEGEEYHRAERELARCLLPLLEEVPDPYRQALRLAEFEDVAQREIASRLGISLSAAKSRVQRARRMLREVVLKCCRIEFDRRGGVADFESRAACDGCAQEVKP